MEGEPEPEGASSRMKMERTAVAYGHPVRAKLLSLVTTEPGSTAAELAEWSGVPVDSVRKQLKELVDVDLVVVQRQEARRGVLRNHYVTNAHQYFSADDIEQLSDEIMLRSLLGTLRLIFDAAKEAMSPSTLKSRDDWMLGNVQGDLDEQGWRELSALHEELLAKSQVVFAESRERLERGSGTPIRAFSSQIFFERRPLNNDSGG